MVTTCYLNIDLIQFYLYDLQPDNEDIFVR